MRASLSMSRSLTAMIDLPALRRTSHSSQGSIQALSRVRSHHEHEWRTIHALLGEIKPRASLGISQDADSPHSEALKGEFLGYGKQAHDSHEATGTGFLPNWQAWNN